MKIDGACHCGAIAYEAEVKEGTVSICHCLDCQRLTGSAFRANIQAPADGFRLVRGSPRRYIETAESGAQRLHAFCGDCGAPIFACDPESPKSYSLRLGALRQRESLGQHARQIWTKRRLPWVLDLDKVPATEGQP